MASLSAEDMLRMTDAEAVLSVRDEPPRIPKINLGRKRSFAAAKKWGKKRQSTREKQSAAQALYYNTQGIPKTHDFVISGMARGRKNRKASDMKKEGCGKGGWKKWTPECILKTAAGAPTAPCRSLCPTGSAPGGPAACSKIISNIISEGQGRGLSDLVAQSHQSKFRFYITNNMFDETKLLIGWPQAQRRSCLAWHSQATWSPEPGDIQDAEIIRPPRELDAYTAAACWGLCGDPTDSAGLWPCGAAMPEAEYKGILTATDSHAVNVLLSKYLVASLPADHFHIASFCMQHRTGSVCEEISKLWGLLPPCFCLASQTKNADFYNDLGSTVRMVLRKYLYVVDPARGPPDTSESDLRMCEFAKELIYLCHVATISDNTERSVEEENVEHDKRKQAADEFLRFFPPPWLGAMTHPCPPGCCGPAACHDRDVSLDRGRDLIMKVIIPRMTTPAANRYTKIFPVCLQVCLMFHFYAVMPKAVRWLTEGAAGDSDEEDSVLRHPDAVVGAPEDAILHMRKLQAKQRTKLRQLCEQCVTNSLLFLVWTVCTQLIMPLHYRLFKRGTWYNRMQSRLEADRRFGCFDFCCGPARNPAAKVLTCISNMLLLPEASGRVDLKLVFLKYGSLADWPEALVVALHTSLVMAFCRLWRLLVWHFDCYPWLLAPGYDPRATAEQRDKAFEDFLSLPRGSEKLDPGAGRKLRELVRTPADLMQATLHDFMRTLFERVVVTSTFVERVFKDLAQWTTIQPQGLPTLGAKHVNREFGNVVKAWREAAVGRRPSQGRKKTCMGKAPCARMPNLCAACLRRRPRV